MANLTKEQQTELSAEMDALIFRESVTAAELRKLKQYNSEEAVVGGIYRMTDAMAIQKVGPAQFKMLKVVNE